MATASQDEDGKSLKGVEDIPQEWIHFLETDQELCQIIQRATRTVVTNEEARRRQMKALFDNVNLAGSCAESGLLSRLFMHTNEFPDNINREVEIDIEVIFLNLSTNLSSLMEDVPNKPGFVKMKYHPEILSLVEEIGWKFKDRVDLEKKIQTALDEDGFLMPYRVKKYVMEKAVPHSDRFQAIELLIAAALKKRKRDISVEHHQNVTNATVDTRLAISVCGEKLLHCSYDAVPLLKLEWWPAVAEEWKIRSTRVWPSQETIEQLTTETYIILKPSDKINENSTELRYAFSHVERKLVSMRSDRQNVIFLLFKIIWVRYVKTIDPDKISSFVAKTVMFWACEEIHPRDDWWNRPYRHILKDLFLRVLEAFKKERLNYFFIPDINIIKSLLLDEKLKYKIIEIVTNIALNIATYIPNSVYPETKAGKDLLELAKAFMQVFEEIKVKHDYGRFLRQPEICVDVLIYLVRKTFMDIKNRFESQYERFRK